MLVISYRGIVWPTYVLIVVTCGVLLILMIILPNAYAQNNPAADIIKKSQENLEKFEERSSTTDPPPVVQKTSPPSLDFTPMQTVNSSLWSQIRGICKILAAHEELAPKEPLKSKNPIQIERIYHHNETDFQALKNIKTCDDVKRAEKNLWLSWKDPDKMFQIHFPATWQYRERQNRFEPSDFGLLIDDSSFMSVDMDYTSFRNLSEVLDGAVAANKDNSNIQVFQREDSSNYVINGHPTAKIIFTIRNQTEQKIQQQVYSLIGDKLLTIQYIAPSNIFDRNLPTVDKEIQSVSVLN